MDREPSDEGNAMSISLFHCGEKILYLFHFSDTNDRIFQHRILCNLYWFAVEICTFPFLCRENPMHKGIVNKSEDRFAVLHKCKRERCGRYAVRKIMRTIDRITYPDIFTVLGKIIPFFRENAMV